MITNLNVELNIRISDDTIKNANEQYGDLTDEEVAEMVASVFINKALHNQSFRKTYFDGVAIIEMEDIIDFKVGEK